MLFLTVKQHREVVRRLLELGRNYTDKIPFHLAGVEYTSLMICFLLHELSATETLLRICDFFGEEWFPLTSGYAIVRTMFETDVAAHYITISPAERARQYIEFEAVLNKSNLDACLRHMQSAKPDWREAMSLQWQHHWGPREPDVVKAFDSVAAKFTHKNKTGKKNYSGTGRERTSGKWQSKWTTPKHTIFSIPNFHRSLMLTCILPIAFYGFVLMGRLGRNEPKQAMWAMFSGMRHHS